MPTTHALLMDTVIFEFLRLPIDYTKCPMSNVESHLTFDIGHWTRLLDDHHGTGAMLADAVAGAAQKEAGDAGMAVLTQNDQVHGFVFSVANEGVGGMAAQNDRAQGHSPAFRKLDRCLAE